MQDFSLILYIMVYFRIRTMLTLTLTRALLCSSLILCATWGRGILPPRPHREPPPVVTEESPDENQQYILNDNGEKVLAYQYNEGDKLPDDLPLYDQQLEHDGKENFDQLSPTERDRNPTFLPPGGLMKMAWVTPILRLNASTIFPNVDIKKLNEDLFQLTNNMYEKLERQWGREACFRKAHCSINNKFFDWQRSGGWDNFFLKHKSVRTLEKLTFKAADRYARAIGLGDLRSAVERGESLSEDGQPFDENSEVTQLIWAGVHKEGIMHHRHDHPFALFSGVYYVSVPPGAGDIVLYDPRPQHSHEDFVFTPIPGEILLFPSWLKHQVQSTIGSNPRIVFAFNIDGKWEGSSDISASYELPLRTTEDIHFP